MYRACCVNKIHMIPHPGNEIEFQKTHRAAYKKAFYCDVFKNGSVKRIASVRLSSTRQFSTGTKSLEVKAITSWNDGFQAAISSESTNDMKLLWGTVFHMQTQLQNIMQAYFYFRTCSNSISQSGMSTIGKLEPTGKITSYVISQCQLTPR